MARCIVRKQATFTRALSSKGRDCGTPAAIVLLRYMGISDVRINVRINVGINVKKSERTCSVPCDSGIETCKTRVLFVDKNVRKYDAQIKFEKTPEDHDTTSRRHVSRAKYNILSNTNRGSRKFDVKSSIPFVRRTIRGGTNIVTSRRVALRSMLRSVVASKWPTRK